MTSVLDEYQRVAGYLNGVSGEMPSLASSQNGALAPCETDRRAVALEVPALTSESQSRVPWWPTLDRLAEEGIRDGMIENVIVHGSWGDFCVCAYSDLDLTLVLPRHTINDAASLEALRDWIRRRVYPFLYSVDPMQHHGPFLLWPELAERYDGRILPLHAYARCWGVKEQTIEFEIEPAQETRDPDAAFSVLALGRLLDAPDRFFSGGYNVYAVKRYLSNLMLVPALYYTDRGEPMHKADSFERFYVEFGESSRCVRTASTLRREWGDLLGPGYPLFARFAFRLPRKVRRGLLYSWRITVLRNRIKQDIAPNIEALRDDICGRLSL